MTIEEIVKRTDHIPSSVYPPEQEMWLKYLYDLPEGTKIVDFGTGWGKSAASLSLACPHGFVVTFDKGDVYVMHKNVSDLGEYGLKVAGYFRDAGVENNVRHFYDADSLSPETMKKVMEVVGKDEIDVLNVDSGHSYETTLEELKLWAPKVRIGGFISLHDWEHPKAPGVREGWDAYMAQGDIKVEFLGLAGCPDEFTVPPLVTMALFRRIE